MRVELTIVFLFSLAFSSLVVRAVSHLDHEHLSPVTTRHVKALILGGGVAGVIAARTFHEQGIDDFLLIEARDELGGRLKSAEFAGKTVELGANWIQGTQTGNGPENPLFALAKMHRLRTQFNDQYGSLTTYDNTGAVNYLDVFNTSVAEFEDHTVYSGARLSRNLVDLSSRSVFDLIKVKPRDAHAKAAEYYNVDYEYAQKPEQNSAVASSWNNNFTYDVNQGGFSDYNLISLDQRGYKAVIQEEANSFLKPHQLRLNSTVESIFWSGSHVKVVLKDGLVISSDYALCTFSLGVLQNEDVQFQPPLPAYKAEAISSMKMATYTKIFLRFPNKFWFDTEMALYADPERGRYPIWQSLDHEHFFPGSGIIFVTVTGDFSERVEVLPDSQIKSEVLSVLQSMYPSITIPTPSDFFFPRWHSDPLYRGSYSNWPPSFVKPHHDNLRSNVGKLYFAGEATSLKYYGFLHGAYFEGLEVAMTMIQCIKHQSCVGLEYFNETQNAIPYGEL